MICGGHGFTFSLISLVAQTSVAEVSRAQRCGQRPGTSAGWRNGGTPGALRYEEKAAEDGGSCFSNQWCAYGSSLKGGTSA
jgi:hypothetical protein